LFKTQTVSLVENIFIRSYISRKYIQLANHEVSNIASPTKCVSAMQYLKTCRSRMKQTRKDCNRDCDRLAHPSLFVLDLEQYSVYTFLQSCMDQEVLYDLHKQLKCSFFVLELKIYHLQSYMENAVLYKLSSFEKYMETLMLAYKPRNSRNAM